MNALRFCALPLAALCFTPALHAQALDVELLDSVKQAIQAEMEAQGMVGLTAAIGLDGDLVWTEGFGFADLEDEVLAAPETVYRLASISKPVTAIAVMQLVETGKIDLDATVRTYVPEWSEKEWPITIRQLLCHQGGVRHYAPQDNRDNTKAYPTATESLEYFADDPLVAEPGTRYSYTTFGYNLLGAVVEGASGRSFVEYLGERVFPRADTEAMQDDSQSRIIKHRAQGYRRVGGQRGQRRGGQRARGELRNSRLVDVSYKLGGGGLSSTASDLVRFIQSVESGRVVTAETRDAMWTRQTTRDGEETSYGLGFQISELEGRRTVGHSGSQRRVQTQLILLPDQGVAVSVMCNTEGTNPGLIARRLATMVADALER